MYTNPQCDQIRSSYNAAGPSSIVSTSHQCDSVFEFAYEHYQNIIYRGFVQHFPNAIG